MAEHRRRALTRWMSRNIPIVTVVAVSIGGFLGGVVREVLR